MNQMKYFHCLYCDERRQHLKAILKHLVRAHHAEASQHGKFQIIGELENPKGLWISCFCGEHFIFSDRKRNRQDWTWHIGQEGGLVAHVLKTALGV